MDDSDDFVILGNLDNCQISGSTDNMNYTCVSTTPVNSNGVYTINLDDITTSNSIDLSGITMTGSPTISAITSDDLKNWSFGPIGVSPFEDCFPDWDDFQAMTKEYPGLEKCYEHLKAFYKLCKDEWEQKKENRN